MLCKWQFISKTARHSFHTTNAISFARVLLKNLKKDQKCILIISEAYKVINFWSYICICMWLHENTPPQFSNKASDDKLKFSTLPSVLPMYTFCRNPKPSKHQLSEGGGGEGGGGDRSKIISPKVEWCREPQKSLSEIMASILEQNKLNWLTSVSLSYLFSFSFFVDRQISRCDDL